jgi:hypothetical protein
LDLIFEKGGAEKIAEHLKESGEENSEDTNSKEETGKTCKGGPVVRASSYDSMLQGESRFWDVISAKKEEHIKKGNDDPFWGPTVGRRRGDTTEKAEKEEGRKDSTPKERTQLETFSIGNEFDFLPVETDESKASPSKRDSLMDALNALDEDEAAHNEADTEEVVFEVAPDTRSKDPIFKSEYDATTGIAASSDLGAFENVEKTVTSVQPVKPTTNQEDEAVDDMDALLATDDDVDFGDLDLGDFDDDDDLEDLENMLKS